MPSSVRDGVRPSAFKMRSYSEAVMLCWASNAGVTSTGSGTTAEVMVIALAFIFAWECGKACASCGVEVFTELWRPARLLSKKASRSWRSASLGHPVGAPHAQVAPELKAVRYFDLLTRPGWRNWQTQRTQN